MIHKVIVGRLGIGRCGEVHSVRLASLLYSLERPGESDHSGVELCDAVDMVRSASPTIAKSDQRKQTYRKHIA